MLITMTQNILITGATGFIGRHLAARLVQEQYRVRCLKRSSSKTEGLKDLDIDWVCGNLTDGAGLDEAVRGCDIIFHLAGQVRANNPAEFMLTNAEGTENLASAAKKVSATDHAPLFVYVSSLAASGPARRTPRYESDFPEPISAYGRSKWAGEQILSEMADDLPCSIVRPGIVFGEGDVMNLELFRTIKRLGFCPIPGWHDRMYSWIHADDLVDLLLRVAQRGERLRRDSFQRSRECAGQNSGHGVYFAAADDGQALSEMGRKIGRSLGRKKTRSLRCPPAAVWGVATYYETIQRLTGRPQPYDWAKAAESMHHWRCSVEKARRQLDFEPQKSLEERLAQTAAWYREQGLD